MASPAHDQVQVLQTKDCVVCDRLIEVRSATCPHCQATQPEAPEPKSGVFPGILIIVTSIGVLTYVLGDRSPR